MEKKISEKRAQYLNEYQRENYGRFNVLCDKTFRDKAKAHAEQRGESISAFFVRAALNQIERDNDGK